MLSAWSNYINTCLTMDEKSIESPKLTSLVTSQLDCYGKKTGTSRIEYSNNWCQKFHIQVVVYAIFIEDIQRGCQ